MCVFMYWLFDWLIAWLVDWLIDWLSDWVIEWLSEWVTDWPIDWLIDWLLDWMNGWLLDWLIELVFLLLLRILAPRLMNPNSACDANMNVDHQGGCDCFEWVFHRDHNQRKFGHHVAKKICICQISFCQTHPKMDMWYCVYIYIYLHGSFSSIGVITYLPLFRPAPGRKFRK